MTIDEAIECEINHRLYPEYHEQIAEWLEELKELQNITAGHLYAVAFNRGYLKAEKEVRNKAIDDFSNALADDLTWLKRFGDEVYNDVGIDVRMRAEQLKAGGENDD